MKMRTGSVQTQMNIFKFYLAYSLDAMILKQTDDLSETYQNSALSAKQGLELIKIAIRTLEKD